MKSFDLNLSVRDYECDLQGIVNNAVYLNYLEHARHEFLLSNGLSFAKLHEEGLDAVVIRSEVDYKKSLKSRDKFTVKTSVFKEGRIRLVFNQKIINTETNDLIVEAKIFTVVLKDGKAIVPEAVLNKII